MPEKTQLVTKKTQLISDQKKNLGNILVHQDRLQLIYHFCDTSLSLEDRAKDLIYNQLEVSELINITGNTAYAIPRLGISSYQWRAEGLHGIAISPAINYSGSIKYTTMFPQVIDTAAS